MLKKIWPIYVLVGVVLLALTVRVIWRDRGYEAVEPKRGDLREAVYALGTVKTDQRFEVKIGVISTVKHVFVNEGDVVEKGAKLIEFESTATFRAPFKGTVTLISSRDGETALPQTVILRLEDLTDRYIELSLEQEAALRVRRGQTAKVSFETVRGAVLNGQVTALFSRTEEFLAKVKVENLDPSVLPGMTADVSVEVGEIKNAWLIPLRAVSSGHALVRDSRGHRQKVKLNVGHVDGTWAEIQEGDLKPGEKVLVPKAKE